MRKIRIEELCSRLDERHYADLQPQNTSGRQPSQERIKALALEKLRQQQEAGPGGPAPEKRVPMKKQSLRILVAAAIACLVTVTAFAAFGGLDYFKAIFGGSAENVADSVSVPLVSDQNDSYKMTLEAMLSDGYRTNAILSLEKLGKAPLPDLDAQQLFDVQWQTDSGSSLSLSALPEFSTKKKDFYRLEIGSDENISGQELTISLAGEVAPLSLKATPDGSMAKKTILLDSEPAGPSGYRAESIQLSPLGALIIGSEQQPKGSLPYEDISLKMKDGSMETLTDINTFDQSADGATVGGGGGVVIGGPGEKLPLAMESHGTRNPENKVVATIYFSRVLKLGDVEAVVVGGKEYPLG